MPKGPVTPRVSVNSEQADENRDTHVDANREEPDDDDENNGSSHSGSEESSQVPSPEAPSPIVKRIPKRGRVDEERSYRPMTETIINHA